jgi:hypothetical protein
LLQLEVVGSDIDGQIPAELLEGPHGIDEVSLGLISRFTGHPAGPAK